MKPWFAAPSPSTWPAWWPRGKAVAPTSPSPSSGWSTRSPNIPGHVKDREALMAAAKMLVDDSTITSHIKRVRRKFEAMDATFDRIETVYGMGYRWNPESET
jgi:hypothetical protein